MLSQLDSAAVAALLDAIADVQLRLDEQGFCIDVAITNSELPDLNRLPWRGNRWLDLCAVPHRERAEEAFARALKHPGKPVRVDIDHQWPELDRLYPMSYRLVASPDGSGVLAIGEDLRGMSDLRQQLLNAQQAMEQDYWALRQMENRYRRLLELTTDGIVVVDVNTSRVLEANTTATRILTEGGGNLVGRPLPQTSTTLQRLLSEARDSSDTVSGRMSLPGSSEPVEALATVMRQGSEQRYLIRLSTTGLQPAPAEGCMMDAFKRAPDAIVQVDDEGRVISSNPVFVDWVQAGGSAEILGRSLDTWLGRSTVDTTVLMNNLREHGSVKLYASVLRNNYGASLDVEISAIAFGEGSATQFVLFIRDISRRVTSEHPLTEHLPRSIEQVTERVGRLPLKELVRESTDIIEALCIEAALKRTQDNRASAAEMLGLSRQSLYTKLRRYGIGENDEP